MEMKRLRERIIELCGSVLKAEEEELAPILGDLKSPFATTRDT